MTSKIARTLRRGESAAISPLSDGRSASMVPTATGVIVIIAVSVGAGKINVKAGNGTNVVVGVMVCEEFGVTVTDGVVDVLVGDWVIVPGMRVTGANNLTAA
jgi:hypothetical protein